MRLAELSARSGLSTATIKYYLRAGLVPPGETEGATWARYDESHLRRLRLVRALTEVAGLALDEVRAVVAALDASVSEHEARGIAQWPLSTPVAENPSDDSREQVDALLARHDWHLEAQSPHRRTLAAALDTLEQLDFPATDEVLDAYLRAAESVAAVDVPRVVAEADPIVAAERLVVGTLLYEPVLTTLRRMAHEVVSGRG
ncbi:MerR family transcriptional regulator [Aeromicrobium tamlense]|uniref:DNA-binding transcriptional MerR regulator n=1 Tax=Aeromicrobium tamlense TaxID=375541 RepID=A0A8I0FSF1_9ACTN|nr:MerR family transcriptional regulator [Aeromicrobium tamlense]MBD1268799.1 MerR family transcriptional regulator [Aeromicrobium tamlense]NYI37295.1 DNA-binding transcriptional MerR regulator [Aeromicrobium tamlense]